MNTVYAFIQQFQDLLGSPVCANLGKLGIFCVRARAFNNRAGYLVPSAVSDMRNMVLREIIGIMPGRIGMVIPAKFTSLAEIKKFTVIKK